MFSLFSPDLYSVAKKCCSVLQNTLGHISFSFWQQLQEKLEMAGENDLENLLQQSTLSYSIKEFVFTLLKFTYLESQLHNFLVSLFKCIGCISVFLSIVVSFFFPLPPLVVHTKTNKWNVSNTTFLKYIISAIITIYKMVMIHVVIGLLFVLDTKLVLLSSYNYFNSARDH